MRAIFSGRWQDNWLLDLIVGGLKETNKGFPQEQVEVIYDGSGESYRAAQLAEARHRVDIAPIDTKMWPQMVFVAHDDLPRDQEELNNILMYLESGIPVYHIRHMDRHIVNRLLMASRRATKGVRKNGGQGKRQRGSRGE